MKTRDALTIRFPPKLLADAKLVKTDSESFNDFVVSAVEREVRLRKGVETFAEILQTREEIFRRVGLQPDSRPLIRALRDSETRRD